MLEVTSFVLSTFFECWVNKLYIYNRESGVIISFQRAQIYPSVSRESETSVSDLATLALVARSTTGFFFPNLDE